MNISQKYHAQGLILLLFALLIIGCSKKKDVTPSNGISHNDSTALYNIFKDISKDNPTMLDIAPIQLPDTLWNSENEGMKMIVETLKKFNELIKNPQNIPSTGHKSTVATDYTKNCETYGQTTICTFKEDHGDYQITIEQIIKPPDYIQYLVSYSGIYNGLDYGEDYLIQSHYQRMDGKSFNWILFRAPDPPESAGQPIMAYLMNVEDEKTIYTPWGTELQRKVTFTSIVYYWDNIKKQNHEWVENILAFDGDTLQMTISSWSINKEKMYISWSATYDFNEMKGEWCAFDDDGIIIECGPIP